MEGGNVRGSMHLFFIENDIETGIQRRGGRAKVSEEESWRRGPLGRGSEKRREVR